MSNPFHFKQFSIEQDQCAMKVGTDGVLLGCFVSEELQPQNVLDIGTGTGLLSLMMAQKFQGAAIEAVEMDEASAQQAEQNFKHSAWSRRLQVTHQRFQDHASHEENLYDLIICNPPFFKEANKEKGENKQHPSAQRAKARFADYLPFQELWAGVNRLLTETGSFYVVLPVAEAYEFKTLAVAPGFYLTHLMEVTGREGALPNRWLMQWKRTGEHMKKSSLLMYHADASPTEAYIEFTKEFYLWKKYDNHQGLKL